MLLVAFYCGNLCVNARVNVLLNGRVDVLLLLRRLCANARAFVISYFQQLG